MKPAQVAGSALYDGSTWEHRRGNVNLTLQSSSQTSSSFDSGNQTNHNHTSATVFFDLTSTGGTTPSVDKVAIQAVDPVSGKANDLVADTSIGSTTGLYVLQVGPGVADAGTNLQAVDDVLLPRTWKFIANVDTADGDETYTFSVGASLVAA